MQHHNEIERRMASKCEANRARVDVAFYTGTEWRLIGERDGWFLAKGALAVIIMVAHVLCIPGAL